MTIGLDPAGQPLPIPVRACAGEHADSYAARLARANHTTTAQLLPAAGRAPERGARGNGARPVWDTDVLGWLGRSRPPLPMDLAGRAPVRRLCPHCVGSVEPAYGFLPHAGLICLKHRCTMHHKPIGNLGDDLPWILHAEHMFRREVAAKVPYGSRVWLAAARCAAVIERRWESAILTDEAADLYSYPLAVKIARMFTVARLGRLVRNETTPDAFANAALCELYVAGLIPGGNYTCATHPLVATLIHVWDDPTFQSQLRALRIIGSNKEHTTSRRRST